MTNRKRRAQKRRRRQVDRAERVLPPPEAAQHHRPWPMQTLLAAGHPDGIDADEFEAALQIVETWKALGAGLGMAAISLERLMLDHATANHGGMSDGDAERIAVWFEWALRLPTGLPSRLVRWIEDEQAIGSVEVLRRACRLWDRVRSDRSRGEPRGVAAVDNPPPRVGLPSPGLWSYGETAARPANRPAGALFIPAGVAAHHIPSSPTGAQMRQAQPRPVAEPSHAHATAIASTARLRR